MTTGEINNPGYGIYDQDGEMKPCRYNDHYYTRQPYKDQRDGRWCEKCLKVGVYTWLTIYDRDKGPVGCRDHYPAVKPKGGDSMTAP